MLEKIRNRHGMDVGFTRPAMIATAKTGLLVMAAWLGQIGFAQADQIVFKTGFEPPIYTIGEILNGSDSGGWTSPGLLSPNAAVIASYLPWKRGQSVLVNGADLVSTGGQTGPYDAIGS